MKNKKAKWILIAMSIILLILIITNPTTNRFKEYLNSQGLLQNSDFACNYGKENNFFIFSFFKLDKKPLGGCDYYPSISYLGIFGNFIELGSSFKSNRN